MGQAQTVDLVIESVERRRVGEDLLAVYRPGDVLLVIRGEFLVGVSAQVAVELVGVHGASRTDRGRNREAFDWRYPTTLTFAGSSPPRCISRAAAHMPSLKGMHLIDDDVPQAAEEVH